MRHTPYAAVLARRGFAGRRIRKVTLNGGFTCPNLDGTKGRGGCTFCDNRAFSPVAGSRSVPIAGQLQAGIAYHRLRSRVDGFIAYFQPFSGTYAPVERLENLYRQALAHPDVVGLSIGTRPDCVDPRVAALLERLGKETFLTLELGLQSAHDESLRRINRGHGFAEFARAMDSCAGRGFDLCVHAILGLPGEGPEHFRATALALRPWPVASVKIHPLHAVRGTALAGEYAAGKWAPLDFGEYVEGLTDFLERVPAATGVQRLTGDAPPGMLLAPLWCRRKDALRAALEAGFARRGTWQGWALGDAPPGAARERADAFAAG
jgi:radical SAM protein (TIGR01212 family)